MKACRCLCCGRCEVTAARCLLRGVSGAAICPKRRGDSAGRSDVNVNAKSRLRSTWGRLPATHTRLTHSHEKLVIISLRRGKRLLLRCFFLPVFSPFPCMSLIFSLLFFLLILVVTSFFVVICACRLFVFAVFNCSLLFINCSLLFWLVSCEFQRVYILLILLVFPRYFCLLVLSVRSKVLYVL